MNVVGDVSYVSNASAPSDASVTCGNSDASNVSGTQVTLVTLVPLVALAMPVSDPLGYEACG